MSSDTMQVRLTLPYQAMMSTPFRQAAVTAFGDRLKDKLHCTRDIVVTCRPDQFAIFMVERNRLGGCNSYKNLDVKLVNPPAHLVPSIDVTDVTYG